MVVVVIGGVQFPGRVTVVLGPFDGATPSPQMPSARGVRVSDVTVVGILYEPENDQLFAWLNAPGRDGLRDARGIADRDVGVVARAVLDVSGDGEGHGAVAGETGDHDGMMGRGDWYGYEHHQNDYPE